MVYATTLHLYIHFKSGKATLGLFAERFANKTTFLIENLMSSYRQRGQFGTISLAKTCKKLPLPKIKIFRDKKQEISLDIKKLH